MYIKEQYLQDEIREGFYVPSMIKRAWAAQLDVLAEIDRICRKHGIQYFAEWGTLLGAVRHNGFIPWDDDLDIGMKRADYERFLEVAGDELPEGYKINNCRNKKDFWLFLARVMNTAHMDFGDDYLKRNHEFPYIAGVDIFLIDYVSRDAKKENRRDTIADYTITLADYIYEKKMSVDEALEGFRKINKASQSVLVYDEQLVRRWLASDGSGGVKEGDEAEMAALHQRMYMYAESMFAMFSDEESDELTQLFPFGLRRKEYRYPKKYYSDCVRLPFENTTIPVPIGYDAMLKRRYGEYLNIRKNVGGHDYPFFESQQEELDKLVGEGLPCYRYTEDEEKYANGVYTGVNAGQSFKQMAVEVCEELRKYVSPQDAQNLAIDFGTMIERLYGEGHRTVGYLEDYCEQLYLYSQGEACEEVLLKTIDELAQSVQRDLLDVGEAVFVVSHAGQWRYLGHEFERVREAGKRIYVVVAPYYHKRFNGTLYDEQNELTAFRENTEISGENVHVVFYDEYDMALHHPECVYIQIPFDEWNHGESVHPSYYTENIVKNCDSMIYIPPFALDEFSKENYHEYHNMSEYVTVPGVVRADTVIVQSETMRELYIDKLTQWAGENTRKLWSGKILGTGTQTSDCENVDDRRRKAMKLAPDSWKERMLRKDGSRKKIVLYHTESSLFTENGERAFEKIRYALDVFAQNKNDVFVIWNIHEDTVQLINKRYAKYSTELDSLRKFADDIGACDISDGRLAQALADAFYGDGSYLSRLCQIDGKPVMVENIDILD